MAARMKKLSYNVGNSLRKSNLHKLWKKIRLGFYRTKQPKTNVLISYTFQNLRDKQEHKRMSEFSQTCEYFEET